MGCKPCAEKRAAVMAAARAGNVREAGNLMAQGAKMMAAQMRGAVAPASATTAPKPAEATPFADSAPTTAGKDSTAHVHVTTKP